MTSLRRQADRWPEFRSALDYVQLCLQEGTSACARIRDLAQGESVRRELEGGCFAIEQSYATRGREECFFESHRRFADVQAVIEGEEWVDLADISQLAVVRPYDGEKDLIVYADQPGSSRLRLGLGDVAVFFPEDGHMPCLRTPRAGAVWKTVVKVPLP